MAENTQFDRVPPQDLEAEQSVLGSMLLSKDAIAEVERILKPDDFYELRNALTFTAIVQTFASGHPADAITIADVLKREGKLNQVGGPEYIHTLINVVPTAASAVYYAEIVRERSILRRLVNAGTRIAQLGYADDGGETSALVDAAQREVMSISEDATSNDYAPLKDILPATVDSIVAAAQGKVEGSVPTGFSDLDELTGGLHPGQMIIVAGRPAMGKSTLALDFCRSAAIHNNMPAAIFSLEMSREEIARRMLAAETNVLLSRLNKGNLEEEDWKKIAKNMDRLNEAPLFIDDSPNLTMGEIRAKARRLKQQHNLQLIAVDYLQLMSSGKRVESRQQEVSEFSRSLKLLAKELQIPVIAAAQLNRGPEQRTDRKPMMADLRESGSLEQDADVIMLLHRPDYYNKEDRPGEADIHVAKHRNGETATIAVVFQGHRSRFGNKAKETVSEGASF
ncbi:replicative DNA helicase [Boudabousia liubingyangii]|uniref:Replicative DNA helicase n=1 Tax=Boudabousia liubingyangii TaxID=1921764 RepID=A0A1Q5PPT3_9ACTO|nr:replicative DNA helicase [Boudabousia liubingyangii]OKL48502.1 replicative DNA helicase [Boudabousia liubingyangii]OKL49460.1 replicative DNA helicase [Boudabousia liubingyangii]